MPRRFLTILIVVLASLPVAAFAGMHRASMTPGTSQMVFNDPLGIGMMSGAMVSGRVAAVAGSIITLDTGSAPAIFVDATNAKFMAEQMGQATLADIVPGARITAFINTAISAGGSTLPAQMIMIDREDDLSIAGAVQAIDLSGSTLRLLGITVAVDENTVFSTAFPVFSPVNGLPQIAVGQIVHVDAKFSGATILATRVDVLAPSAGISLILRGNVKSIGDTQWVITTSEGSDTTVLVNDQTQIVGNPRVGDAVQVMASVLPNPKSDTPNQVVALAIVNLNATVPPSGTMTMGGWVRTIGANEWTIGGPMGSMMPDFLVKIAPATLIYPNPKVGDHVIVSGTRDSSGFLVAQKIALQP